jgi:hypothetical protein
MRSSLLAGLTLLGVPVTGLAQTGEYFATVVDPEVTLRAGPSDKFPETATLPKGAQLIVVKEESNGWLAVRAPDGKLYSMSWVQGSFIDFNPTKPIPQPVTVHGETTITLAAGQIGLAQPLSIRRTEVPSGTGLVVIGTKVQFEGRWWYPVLPPEGDYRYVPKQALKIDKPAHTTFTVHDTLSPAGGLPTGSAGSLPVVGTGGMSSSLPPEGPVVPRVSLPPEGPAPATAPSKPVVQHPLWAQAEAAERDGRLDDAEKLYFQLARLMNEPGGDHDIANMCYSRIHSLREKKRNASGVTPSSGVAPASGGTSSSVTAPTPRPTLGEPTKPASGTQSSGSGASSAPVADDGPRWTGQGRLRRSAMAFDGRRTYILEASPGVTAMYAVGGQGIDLEKYVSKNVNLYGVVGPYRGISKPYVVVTGVDVGQ